MSSIYRTSKTVSLATGGRVCLCDCCVGVQEGGPFPEDNSLRRVRSARGSLEVSIIHTLTPSHHTQPHTITPSHTHRGVVRRVPRQQGGHQDAQGPKR